MTIKTIVPALSVSLLFLSCSAELVIPEGIHVACSTDAECPVDFVCAVGIERCVEKTSDCVTHVDGESQLAEDGRECLRFDAAPGICLGGACQLPTCGDAVVTEPEACDPGEERMEFVPDACRPGCIAPACGDGIVDSDEACDLGESNSANGQCTPECTENFCGDGFRGLDEECDDGNEVNLDGCLNDCRSARCGDHFVQAGVEACDDGNTLSGDGCSDCKLPECGNAVAEGQEQCDDGNDNQNDDCLSTCFVNTCGDGFRRTAEPKSEECDDAANNGDGISACTVLCTSNICGDGYLHTASSEECDERHLNGVPGRDCTFDCTLNVCGDGHVGPVDPGNPSSLIEACDSGAAGTGAGPDDDNGEPGNACTAECTFDACGDGHRGPGEQCDLGASGSEIGEGNDNGEVGSTCTDSCRSNVCGDGLLGGAEACDNGSLNGTFGNGCTAGCTANFCGDEHVGPNETCDLGAAGTGAAADDDNGEANSVCTSQCLLNVCGDGHHGFGEGCDDGNKVSHDGCSLSCQSEDHCISLGSLACPTGATEFCTIAPTVCGNGDPTMARAACERCGGEGACGDLTANNGPAICSYPDAIRFTTNPPEGGMGDTRYFIFGVINPCSTCEGSCGGCNGCDVGDVYRVNSGVLQGASWCSGL